MTELSDVHRAALIIAGAALTGRGSEDAWENLERVLFECHGDLWTGQARREFAAFEEEQQ